jgi:hypothetical protein
LTWIKGKWNTEGITRIKLCALITWLNKLGKEGWELVATDSQKPDFSSRNVVYMKRRKITGRTSKSIIDDEMNISSLPPKPIRPTSPTNVHINPPIQPIIDNGVINHVNLPDVNHVNNY